MKAKKLLIFIILISQIFVLGSCTSSKTNKTASKESNTIKSEITSENNSNEDKLKEKNNSAKEGVNDSNKGNLADKNNLSSKKSTSNVEKEENDNSLVYKSKLGFSIIFPSNWRDRYRIKEDNNSMYVYFKSTDPNTLENSGLLFLIIKNYEPEDEYMYDSIDGSNYVTVGNTTYFIGGPTDVGLNPDNSDYSIYVAMGKERKKVIDTVAALH